MNKAYNINTYNFRELVCQMLATSDLENLHSTDVPVAQGTDHNDLQSSIYHKNFYKDTGCYCLA